MLTTTFCHLNAVFGSLDEPLTDYDSGSEGKAQDNTTGLNARAQFSTCSQLDAAFGRLDEPLTELESGDENEQETGRDGSGKPAEDVPKKKRRGRCEFCLIVFSP